MYCDLGVFLLLYVGMTHSPALHSPHLMVAHKDGHPSPGGAGSSFTPVTSMHHHHNTTVDIETPPRPLSTHTPGMQSHPQASSSPLSNHGNTQGIAPSYPSLHWHKVHTHNSSILLSHTRLVSQIMLCLKCVQLLYFSDVMINHLQCAEQTALVINTKFVFV